MSFEIFDLKYLVKSLNSSNKLTQVVLALFNITRHSKCSYFEVVGKLARLVLNLDAIKHQLGNSGVIFLTGQKYMFRNSPGG